MKRQLKHSHAISALMACGLMVPHALACAQSTANPAASSTEPAPALVGGGLPARLSEVEGAVRVAASAPAQPVVSTPGGVPPPPPDTVYDTAQENMPLLPGAILQTGSDGQAEVQFEDGSLARATPDSSLGLVTETSGSEQIEALAGLTYYEVPAGGAAEMAVRLGAFRLTPSAESLIRIDMDAQPYQIAALRGSVRLDDENAGVVFTLQQGQSVSLDPADPTNANVDSEIAASSWDQWNADRDDTLASMGASTTSARAGSEDANAGAWDDLDYYGTWYAIPGAGEAWAPDGVDEDFDPYGNGSWAYYNNIGYTWISAYPWGWLPYHCGNWNYFTGFGWMWQPGGGCGTGWFPYTGFSHAPAGYQLPKGHWPAKRPVHPRLGGIPIGPVYPVDRGPLYRFRAVSGDRPDRRLLPLPAQDRTTANGGYAAILPVAQVPAQAFRNTRGFARVPAARPVYMPDTGRRGYTVRPQVTSPTPRAISPTPHAISPTPRAISPTPRAISPTPRVYTPPPRIEMPRAAEPSRRER